LSWLPFSQVSSRTDFSRSLSVQLPKATSTSTVARSVISAPVLTSTTNVGVAHAEGVHCGEISGLSFSQSTCVGQSGLLASSEHEKSTGVPQHESNNRDAQNQQAVVSANSAGDTTQPARSRMSRFRNVLRSKVRSIPYRHAERKSQPPVFDAILRAPMKASILSLQKEPLDGGGRRLSTCTKTRSKSSQVMAIVDASHGIAAKN